MDDLFGLKIEPQWEPESDDDGLPSLEHIVNLMRLPESQVAAINETDRLEESKHRVFQVVRNIFLELNKLGGSDWDLFETDKRLGPAVRLYREWAFEQLAEQTLPAKDGDRLEFQIGPLSRQQLRWMQIYKAFYGGSYGDVNITTASNSVEFNLFSWRLQIPASVKLTGEHTVPAPFYKVLMDHLNCTRCAEVEIVPMRYQVNNTTIYPARPDNCFDAHERFLKDKSEFLKSKLAKQLAFVRANNL